MRKKLLLIVALAVIILPLLLTPLNVLAADPWVGTGWAFRESHVINGATAAGTGYQVMLTVHSGAGADTGDDVYLDGYCTNFPEDITFTDNDGTTELAHFCEDLTADPAIFWVKVNDSLSSPSTASVYVYYGKTGQTSRSRGATTFPALFDGWDTLTYGSWSTKASLPTVRLAVSNTPYPLYGGKIYIIGGWDATQRVPNTTIYNVAGNTYSSGTNYPATGIAGSSQALYNGRIYVFGGVLESTGGYTNYLRIYDITANTWSSGANVPWSAEGMFAIADPTSGLIYVGGGCELPVALHNEWAVYNTATNTWASKGVMPTTRGNGIGVYYGGNLYITAGAGVTGTTLLDTTWRYNLASETWTTDLALTPTKVLVSAYDLHQATGRIYMFGGKTSAYHTYTNVVQVYDIPSNTWLSDNPDYEFLPVPASYGYAGGAFSGTTFYMFGGWDGTTRYSTLRTDNVSVSASDTIDTNKWNQLGATVSGGVVTIDVGGDYLQSKSTFQYKAARFRTRTASNMSNTAQMGVMENLIGSLDYAILSPRTGALAWAITEKAANYEIDVIPTYYAAYHVFDIGRTSVSVTYRQDNTIIATTTNTTCVPINAGAVAFLTGALGMPSGPEIKIDWVAVRSYVDPEPTHGAWGAEEENPIPIIYTVDASRVACTTARLNSVLATDGNLPVTVRFGWGNTTQAIITNYDHYQTLSGYYSQDQHPYLDVTGLNFSTLYYFRVESTNANGSYLGAELTFTTTNFTGTPQNFRGIPADDHINLSWDPLLGASNYLIRYKVGGYPTGVTDGTQVYFGSSVSAVHTGLTPGKTYHYMLWGESGGAYSSNATLMRTTNAGAGGGASPTFTPPTEIARWLTGTDYTSAANLGFVYAIVNGVADSIAIPRGNAWFILSIGMSVIMGLFVLLKSNGKMLPATGVMTALFVLGWAMKLLPFWIPLIGGVLIIAFFVGHREVARG